MFPAVGRCIITALSYISVRMEEKKQQQQMKGWFETSGRTAAGREREREGRCSEADAQSGVVGDEVERHDFRNKSIRL